MVKKNDTNSKPVVPTAAAPSTPATPAPAPTKRAVKPAAKSKKTVAKTPKAPAAVKAKRTTKPKTSKTPAVLEAPKAPAAPAYTREDVALRAYFISEKRRAHGHHGNEHQDWLEAERQLLAESTVPVKKAKKA